VGQKSYQTPTQTQKTQSSGMSTPKSQGTKGNKQASKKRKGYFAQGPPKNIDLKKIKQQNQQKKKKSSSISYFHFINSSFK